jgi:hypothetical protein
MWKPNRNVFINFQCTLSFVIHPQSSYDFGKFPLFTPVIELNQWIWKKWKTLTEKLRDRRMKVTHKPKGTCGTIITACSHTFTVFWLRKASVIAKIYQVSVCLGLCITFIWRSLHFLVRVFPFFSYLLSFLYFGTFLSMWSPLD